MAAKYIRFHFDALTSVANETGTASVEQMFGFEDTATILDNGARIGWAAQEVGNVNDSVSTFLAGVAAMLNRDVANLNIDDFVGQHTNMPVWAPYHETNSIVLSEQVGIMYWQILSQDEIDSLAL